MTDHALDADDRDHAYEQAFDDLWQQTCLGRLSVAEVKERLLALKQRFGMPQATGRFQAPGHQALR